LLLVAADRSAYLPLFPLALFGRKEHGQPGVFLLQRWQWLPDLPRRLKAAHYVAYEAGLDDHTESSGDAAAVALERLAQQLEARGPRRAPDPPPSATTYPDAGMEKRYLDWLANYILSKSKVWHKSPIEQSSRGRSKEWNKSIVEIGAHKKRRAEYGEGLRALLFRYNASDYALNPALSDLELSVRAGFGKRARIKNLARELRKYTKIVVLGDPGSGKSVCLRQLAYELAMSEWSRHDRPAILPLFVEMGAYNGWQDQQARKPTPILEFLAGSLRQHEAVAELPHAHPFLDYLADSLERLLEEGRIACIFDALDEMPQESYQERYQALKKFMQACEDLNPRNRFIYSCRSLDYDPSFSVDEVIIDPFDQRRIRKFLYQNLNAPEVAEALYRRIQEEEALAEIASNPFFLQALTYINVSSSVDAIRVPRTRGELIRLFVETLLGREAVLKQKEHLKRAGGLEVLQRFLAELGYALQERPEEGTSARTESFADIWKRYPEWPLLLWIARRARLLGKRGEEADQLVDTPPSVEPPRRIEFVHHRLQEFFAARELARRLEAGEDVGNYLEDIWWQETVILAIGIVNDPRPILQRMLAPRVETDDWLDEVLNQARLPIPGEAVKGHTDARPT
jgi:hypothetical protein